jgi:hypothetical protein
MKAKLRNKIISSHAQHLRKKYGVQRAAKYLSRNGIKIQTAFKLLLK